MAITKVVSGGQTGVDRAALDAAISHRVEVGGWCPAGRRAEDGVVPNRYPLRETPSVAYAERTAWNVRDSDGTILITDGAVEGGTKLTREEAEDRGKPVLHVRTTDPVPVEMIRAWREEHNIRVLNVAGPRESEAPGIYGRARIIMEDLLDKEAEPSDGGSTAGRSGRSRVTR